MGKEKIPVSRRHFGKAGVGWWQANRKEVMGMNAIIVTDASAEEIAALAVTLNQELLLRSLLTKNPGLLPYVQKLVKEVASEDKKKAGTAQPGRPGRDADDAAPAYLTARKDALGKVERREAAGRKEAAE